MDTGARGQCDEAAAALVQADALLGASPGPHWAPFCSFFDRYWLKRNCLGAIGLVLNSGGISDGSA